MESWRRQSELLVLTVGLVLAACSGQDPPDHRKARGAEGAVSAPERQLSATSTIAVVTPAWTATGTRPLRFGADCRELLAARGHRLVRLDVESGACVGTSSALPEGRVAGSADLRRVAAVLRHRGLSLHDLQGGAERSLVTDASQGSGRPVNAAFVGEVHVAVVFGLSPSRWRVWELATGRMSAECAIDRELSAEEKSLLAASRSGFEAAGRALAGFAGGTHGFSRDGRTLAVGGELGSVRAYDTLTGQLVAWVGLTGLKSLLPSGRAVNDVAVSSNRRHIATAQESRDVHVYRVETGQRELTLENGGGYGHVAITPNGQRLVSIGWFNSGRVWALPSGRRLFDLAIPEGFARYTPDILLISADGRFVAACNDHYGETAVWKLPEP
ncbi:WD40 repeat domain-containing protein [Planctomycetota bacterium]